jgi:hypothetical protein
MSCSRIPARITRPGAPPFRLGMARGALRVLAAAILWVAVSGTSRAQDEIFVTNASNNSVTVYSRIATGNAAPLRTISGAATGISLPQGVAVDTVNDEVAVANSSSITVFARTANGNAAPLRTISGGATGLSSTRGLAVDTVHDELVVASGATVKVFARTASGNVAPLRTISGASTLLNNPQGVAVDTVNDELVVANVNNVITVFARTANGNVAPLRTISGAATGLNSPRGVAVDAVHNEIAVANALAPSLTIYGRTATGNTAPLRTISGGTSGVLSPIGVATDPANNEISFASFSFNYVSVFTRTANGNVAPLRNISGAATALSGPSFLAIGTGGPPPSGAPFYTVTPCRLADTRGAAGVYGGPALAAGADRTFVISGQCGIPSGAKAVAFNLTITQATGAGDLRVFPSSGSLPLVSTLNWSPGQTRANNAVLSLGPAGDITVHLDQAGGTADLIIDVNGYFQ